MKEISYKINLAFLILFFLIIFISFFEVYNIFKTYENNRNLQSKSFEIANTVYQLEDLTSKLNNLGQRHILAKSDQEMNRFNKEIENTYLALDSLIREIVLDMEHNGNKDNITAFIESWENYWIIYQKAMELSRENNEVESKNLLLKADNEFEQLNVLYIEPLEDEYYKSFTEILESQNKNYEGLILVGILMLIVAFVGFIFAYIYLQKIIKESIGLRKKLEFLAYHDELTGVPNRRMFQQQVNKEIEHSKGKFALLYLDMDKFKSINDKYGHEIGDLILKEFSKGIQKCIRQTDILGRQGGDEFTVLLKDISKDKVIEIANRIIQSFNEPVRIEGQIFQISTSIGIAIYPLNGRDYLTLLKNADHALYKAKKKRNSYVISDVTYL